MTVKSGVRVGRCSLKLQTKLQQIVFDSPLRSDDFRLIEVTSEIADAAVAGETLVLLSCKILFVRFFLKMRGRRF